MVASRYRILRQLGRGGMGEVYAAENTRTGRHVAVKLLRAEAKLKKSAVERFRREAKAAGSIRSEYVTEVLDVDDDADAGICLVFELLEGESLIERLKRTGPMPFNEVFQVVEQVWLGLAAAHKVGIIHRDLKPSNVFLLNTTDGRVRVKILDFGISKLPRELGGETLTEMGQSLGTFSFMPPEQIGRAKTVDHRADIYACATLVYQSLSGQLPYLAKNILNMVEMKTKQDPRKLQEAMRTPVDPALEAFIKKGLERNPEDRFATADEALAAWRRLARQESLPDSNEISAGGTLSDAAKTIALPQPAGLAAALRQPPPDTASGPPSSAMTPQYTPGLTMPLPVSAASHAPRPARTSNRPRSGKRKRIRITASFIFGALGFALLGFLIAAVVVKLVSRLAP